MEGVCCQARKCSRSLIGANLVQNFVSGIAFLISHHTNLDFILQVWEGNNPNEINNNYL